MQAPDTDGYGITIWRSAVLAIGLTVLVAVTAYALSRARGQPGTGAERAWAPLPELDEWVALHLLTPEQASAIRAHEAAKVPPVPAGPRTWRAPAVAEPLGYLGAVLAVIGLLLVVSRVWPDMSTVARLALSGGSAAAGVFGGSLVRETGEAALARLRGALWLAATAAAGLFGGIAVADGLGSDAPASVVLGVAGAVAGLSGVLWRGADRPVQQATALGGAVTAAAAAGARADWPVGAGVTTVLAGAVVLSLGIRRATSAPPLSAAIGALGVVAGGQLLAGERPALQLVTVAIGLALVGLASVRRLQPRTEHTVAGAVGLLALLFATPATLGYFAAGAGVATGLVTMAVGAGVLAVGLRGLVERAALVEVVGGLAVLGGAALTGAQASALAPVLGVATAIGLLVLGAWSGQLRHSVLGALGLLVHVPWAIGRFFPGDGRVPLLIMVAGGVVLGLAVLLARHGDRGTPRLP